MHCFDRCVSVLMTTSVHFAVLIILRFLPQRIVLTTVHCFGQCARFVLTLCAAGSAEMGIAKAKLQEAAALQGSATE